MANETVKEAEALTPDPLKKFTNKEGKAPAEEIFTGDFAHYAETLKEKGVVSYNGGQGALAADFDADGNVIAMAAAVSRTPTRSDTYLTTFVPDLKENQGLDRKGSIKLYRQLAKKEGVINNAIKKKAALVSQEGNFVVRSARQGKRPRPVVAQELLTLLTFWSENVNSSDENSAITGSRGVRQVVRRGSKQALIEGDAFLREAWSQAEVPMLGKKFDLPMTLQAMPADEIEIAEELKGLGLDLYFWVPDSVKVQTMLGARDPVVKEIVEKTVSKEILDQLRKTRKVLLDPSLLIHIKNSAMDTDSYGESDVEATLTDIAYSRALKSLDFVTIDSLVNRMLIIKVGDENPESAYHQLAIAQKRVNVLKNLMSSVGPNMMIMWAGHDISAEDVGAHSALLDTDDRQAFAQQATKLATGVPDPLLTGSADGGNAVAWAGFIALGAVASEMQEEWTQSLTQLGRRIAEANNYKDVDVVWQFSHTLLADREASAKLIVQAFDRGAVSKRTLIEELGLDYDVEKGRKQDEVADADLFEPPAVPKGGPGGNQGIDPKAQPGKPSDKGNPDKVGPERDRETKKIKGT